MTARKIRAIFSDYDGTLVPTANVKDPKTNTVPKKLEEILRKVSAEIPVSVISTKDYEFLMKRTPFAKILSCMMGIETLVMTNGESSRIIGKRFVNVDGITLKAKSKVLQNIAQEISSQKDFSRVGIEYKHTTEHVLAGLTIDWRHLNDWSRYSAGINHFISMMTSTLQSAQVPTKLHVQKYSTHPLIDIYSIKCNKGMAFDTVVSELVDAGVAAANVLYLGDSENDNPAFRRAGVSIGIRSDTRLNPKLDSNYFLSYKDLPSFLMNLRQNDYLFTDESIVERKA